MLNLKELSQEEILELIDYAKSLREKNLSYSQISKKIERERGVKISKSTIIRWCKNSNNPFNKTKLVDLSPSSELSYIIGVYFGDASLYYRKKTGAYYFRIKVVDKDFAEAVKDSLAKIGLKPTISYVEEKTRSNRWHVEASSKSLYKFLSQDKEELFKIAEKYPEDFLRGFFDSEGYVTSDKIALENYDLELLEFSKELLKKLDIHSTIHIAKKKGTESNIRGEIYYYKDDFYALSIHRKEAVKNFAVKIGFSIKRKQDKLQRLLESLNKY
jgi:intein-encoded DNA endonuclease-like protein